MKKNEEIIICKSLFSDIQQIFKIQQECRLSFWTIENYEEELTRNDSISLTAKFEDKTVGFLVARLLSPNLQENKPAVFSEAEILNFGILENYQKQGIGNNILSKFLLIAHSKKVKSVWLEVRVSNQNAINFYKSKGFTETQRRKNFYTLPTEDAIIMKLDLSDTTQINLRKT